jgi:hypothetical protein
MNDLEIKIANESLELRPGTMLEIERNNPFLQFSDEVTGDYSVPFDVDLTPKNNRILAYAGLIQNRIDSRGLETRIHGNGTQHSLGKTKIEKPSHNLNRSSDGSISLYYLSGIASFYQDVKDRKLQEVDLGGDRTFAWDSANHLDFLVNGNGFWGHLHKVIDAPVNGYDYAFYPLVNKGFLNINGSSDLINNMGFVGGRAVFNELTTGFQDINPIVPFPYLHYVLKKAMDHVGWKIEGAFLEDPDFKKITLVNFVAINWGGYSPALVRAFGFGSVKFNLQNHVPTMTIPEFLLALKNRFGWWLDFDRVSKTIRIKTLQDAALGQRKNLTPYASPLVIKTVAAEKKIYALKNNFFIEYKNGQPDFTKVSLQGYVVHQADLPAAAEDKYGQVYLVTSENNYYICRLDETDGTIKWKFFSYNVYDVIPIQGGKDVHNEEIVTACVTLGMESYNVANFFVPRIDAEGGFEGRGDEPDLPNAIVLFYHGKRPDLGGTLYPYASSHIYDNAGNQVATWSLAFQCKKNDGTEVGLYDLYWKKLTQTIAANETFQVVLHLPLIEYLKLQFSDIINIANVDMYLTKIRERVPYDGSVEIEAVRS